MLKSITKKAILRLGYDVHRYKPWTHLHAFFRGWMKLGLRPRRIFDIGANHGDWTRAAREYFPDADYLLVEPQAQLERSASDLLRLPSIRWKTLGVSDTPGILKLNLARRDDSASFRSLPREVALEEVAQVEVDVVTLDELARIHGLPDLVKIDAEGFDLRVLKGATTLLGTTEVFLIECAVCGGGFENTMTVVLNFMDQHGYTLVDLTDLNRSPSQGVLWLCEAAFVLKKSKLWENLGPYEYR